MISSALRPALRAVASTSRASLLLRPAPQQLRTLVTKKYAKSHEWISFDDQTNIGTVGISDYAQNKLGDVVFVELPSVDTAVESGDEFGAVESVKAASDIYAPVSGDVHEINEGLADKPTLINTSPEDEGWLVKIKVTDSKEFEDLLSVEQYKTFCESGAESS
ncbi:hypothetical protein MNV49_003840 [Pseudohyphozyma bogoriensis]|nr:hypothetical protein MNV49_003840 [Pseudohyphozyma bogoriensis]